MLTFSSFFLNLRDTFFFPTRTGTTSLVLANFCPEGTNIYREVGLKHWSSVWTKRFERRRQFTIFYFALRFIEFSLNSRSPKGLSRGTLKRELAIIEVPSYERGKGTISISSEGNKSLPCSIAGLPPPLNRVLVVRDTLRSERVKVAHLFHSFNETRLPRVFFFLRL